jgi:hypothetical protein
MQNAVTNAAASVKNFVIKHKTAIAVTAAVATTAVVVVKLHEQQSAIRDEFLEERGLTDAFNNWLVEENI